MDDVENLEQVIRCRDPPARSLLADLYQFGRPVPKNLEGDAKLFMIAAYMRYEGAEHTLEMIAERFRFWAGRGHADAQCMLGKMHLYGIGIRQSDPEAAKWYGLAADQGSMEAQYMMGWMYQNGRCVPKRK